MTTSKQSLRELKKAVEGGGYHSDLVTAAFDDAWLPVVVNAAYEGSLDAAIQLLEAVLPWWWDYELVKRGLRYTAYVQRGIEYEYYSEVSRTPSRALLLAILDALIDKEFKKRSPPPPESGI